MRDRDVELAGGELFVVPRGVEHCPEACHVGTVGFVTAMTQAKEGT